MSAGAVIGLGFTGVPLQRAAAGCDLPLRKTHVCSASREAPR